MNKPMVKIDDEAPPNSFQAMMNDWLGTAIGILILIFIGVFIVVGYCIAFERIVL